MAPDKIGAEELFRRHAVDVGRFFRMLGLRGAITEDLVQQVFLIVHRKGGFETGPAKPMTWLRAIAVRVASDHRKSERRRRLDPDDSALDEAPSQAANPEEAAAVSQDLTGLQRALASLSFDHRAVFVLFELERESFESIARILDIPMGTVGSRLTTARAKVMEQYRPKAASPKSAKETVDPDKLRADPATPAPLREDLDAAVRASQKQGPQAERIGHLLRHLGAGEEELGPLVEKVIEVAQRLRDHDALSLETRLREIAVHVALDQERRRSKASSGADPPHKDVSERSRLVERLRQLGIKPRAALVLHEIEGETCDSIGRILDHTAPSAVVALLEVAHRALVEAYRAPLAGRAILSSKSRGGVS